MPKQRLRMKQILEIMRLRYGLSCSQQAVSDATGIARSTVKDYLLRVQAAGLSWPLPQEMTNEQLNELIFPSNANKSSVNRPKPDWSLIHKELKRKSVTLQLLWEEYKKANPEGYQYSHFANLYRGWAKKKDVWMPQTHKAGEKVFVDYSGLKVPIWSTNMQQVLYEAEIFVSTLGASDLIYCIATKTQQIPDWIEANNRMLSYYGGAPELIIPDNLRSGVTKAHRYEPQCQATYEELGQHYQCAIMPARAYKPKDKAKVEKAVQLVQQRILAAFRHEKFVSLEQLNDRIQPLLEELNHRYSKSFGCSRWALFNEVEKEALTQLPSQPYEVALWRQQQVNGGYHVSVNKHHYSVPYKYVRKKVDIRVTGNAIEIFHQDERIACHLRDDSPGAYSTVKTHRPESHQQQAQWNSQRLQSWANGVGPATQLLIEQLFTFSSRHLYQKEKSALGILRLSHAYSEEALEQACKSALDIGTHRYESIVSLLKRQLNVASTTESDSNYQTPDHENVRGPQYYH